jgi:transposase-like protein
MGENKSRHLGVHSFAKIRKKNMSSYKNVLKIQQEDRENQRKNHKSKQMRYSKEFQEEAIKLIEKRDQSIAMISHNLGVSVASLNLWRRKHLNSNLSLKRAQEASKIDSEEYALLSKNLEEAYKTIASLQEEKEKEKKKLTRKIATCAEEREILKKAMAFFVRKQD